jgi:carbamoyl-phosphate synthase large subunit
MGLERSFDAAFLKSLLSAGTKLPEQGTVFISVRDRDKPAAAEMAARLVGLGFKVLATRGTAAAIEAAGAPVAVVNKVLEGRPHVLDAIANGEVALMLNTTEGAQAIADSFSLRRAALTHKIPYCTTVAGARAAVQAIARLKAGGLEVAPLQSYL